MILSFPNQQVTQLWDVILFLLLKTTKITRSKLPVTPAHSRQTWFHCKSQPSWFSQSLHHAHSQDHWFYEDCEHLISIATEQLKAWCLLSETMKLLPLHAAAVISGYSSELPCLQKPFFKLTYRALLLVPGSSPKCCWEHTSSLGLPLGWVVFCFFFVFSELSLETSPSSVLFSSFWLIKRQENTWRIPEQILIKPNPLQSKITEQCKSS